MKTLMYVMVVAMAIASPVCADTILQESFEGGTPGTALNTLGWSGDSNIVISSAVIDSGQSGASASGVAWPAINKGFSYTPGAGEYYTLTATLYAPGTGGEYADVRVQDASNATSTMQGVAIGYGDMQFGVINVAGGTVRITPQPTAATDIMIELYGDSSKYYYKAHGPGAWTYAGEKTGLGFSLSSFDEIQINGHGDYAGGIDSIVLSTTTPEPSSVVLLALMASGLLAYAWRKRK
jgi:hypothetical protein